MPGRTVTSGIFAAALAALTIFAPVDRVLAETITLKLAVGSNPNQARTIMARRFADRIKELTNGEVVVNVYDSFQLGQAREILEGMQFGTVDFTVEASGLIGGLQKEFNVVYLPFRWQDKAHVERFVASPMWTEWTDKLNAAKGLKTVATVVTNPRQLITVNGPVKTPADLQGVKLRVPESAAPMAIWRAIGAIPVPIAYGESYQALQQSVVGGAEADPTAIVAASWPEVAKHVAMTNHTIDAWLVLVSERTMDRLSESQRAAVIKAGEGLQEVADEADGPLIEAAIKTIRGEGVEISEPDNAAFLAEAADTVKTFTEEYAPGANGIIEAAKQ